MPCSDRFDRPAASQLPAMRAILKWHAFESKHRWARANLDIWRPGGWSGTEAETQQRLGDHSTALWKGKWSFHKFWGLKLQSKKRRPFSKLITAITQEVEKMALKSLCVSSVPFSQGSDQQHGRDGLGALKETWKETILYSRRKKKRSSWENVRNMVWRWMKFFSNHNKTLWPALLLVCFRPWFSPESFFFCFFNLCHRSAGGTQTALFKNKHGNLVCVYLSSCHIYLWFCGPSCSVRFHAGRKTLFLGPLYRWTGKIASPIILHNHFYLVPSCFFFFFFFFRACLKAKLWGNVRKMYVY